ncbi:MAG: hypothetical protein J2P18_18555 [Nocardia sp.]|nr:hypothetical protein [Nocardia sp.]
MPSETPVHWRDEPQNHDYPAAADYLDLIADKHTVEAIVDRLRKADIVHKKAKDILRAARLDLLPTDNPHVRSDLDKIGKGESLSPILLVRGDLGSGVATQIADGYHRVCACYHTDENTDIPVKLVTPPRGKPGKSSAGKSKK